MFNRLSKVRVDDRVLRVLTAVPVAPRLRDLAMRGARYGMPGWVETEEVRGGRSKRVYLEGADAEAKARDYLAGATSAGEIAGRTLALIVMAIFADQDAVAQSRRSYYAVSAEGMPWCEEVGELIDALVTEHLGDQLLGDRLGARAQTREQLRAERAAQQAARCELADKLGRLDGLTVEELHAMEELIAIAHGGYRDSQQRDQATKAVRRALERRQDGDPQSKNNGSAAHSDRRD
ncbi:MAG TPA: hypothetical protein VE571_08960 [Solirubrobacteraceae bacterium]|nr:hypothetical protein [Solirubrobacteraceae bacterium]